MTPNDHVALQCKRSYTTYLARLEGYRRLRAVGIAWNAAQVALSGALLATSVAAMAFQVLTTPVAQIVVVALAILALVASIFSISLDYSGRARAMFHNYRALQAYSVKVETLESRGTATFDDVDALQLEYDALLDSSENHLQYDYLLSQRAKITAEARWGALLPYVFPAAMVGAALAILLAAFAALSDASS